MSRQNEQRKNFSLFLLTWIIAVCDMLTETEKKLNPIRRRMMDKKNAQNPSKTQEPKKPGQPQKQNPMPSRNPGQKACK